MVRLLDRVRLGRCATYNHCTNPTEPKECLMATEEDRTRREEPEPWVQRWEELGKEEPAVHVETPPRPPRIEPPLERVTVERRRPLWRTALGHSLILVALLATGAFIVVYLQWIQGEADAAFTSLLIYFAVMAVALIAARILLRRK